MAYSHCILPEGKELEKVLSFVGRHWKGGTCTVDTTGTNKDKLEGTDFEVLGVRCDATTNPEKTNVQWFNDKSIVINLDDVDSINVRFGVRTGNSVVEFETPVLVLMFGSKSNRFLYSKINTFSEALLEMFDEIIDLGMDSYWEFIDSHPQYEV